MKTSEVLEAQKVTRLNYMFVMGQAAISLMMRELLIIRCIFKTLCKLCCVVCFI